MQEKDTDAVRTSKYEGYIQACAEHLGELPGSSAALPAPQATQHGSYLFEGQMSSVHPLYFVTLCWDMRTVATRIVLAVWFCMMQPLSSSATQS